MNKNFWKVAFSVRFGLSTGAHDAYKAGAKVSHNGKHWINTYGDGNSWEPGVYGWTEQ